MDEFRAALVAVAERGRAAVEATDQLLRVAESTATDAVDLSAFSEEQCYLLGVEHGIVPPRSWMMPSEWFHTERQVQYNRGRIQGDRFRLRGCDPSVFDNLLSRPGDAGEAQE